MYYPFGQTDIFLDESTEENQLLSVADSLPSHALSVDDRKHIQSAANPGSESGGWTSDGIYRYRECRDVTTGWQSSSGAEDTGTDSSHRESAAGV